MLPHSLAGWQAEKYHPVIMRIALVHYSAPPVIGGVERIIEEQGAVLRSAGHHVTLVCCEGGDPEHWDGLIPICRSSSQEDLFIYLASALCSMDAVLLHNVGTMPFFPTLTKALRRVAATLPSVRWLCWVHDLVAGNEDYLETIAAHDSEIFFGHCKHWDYVAISNRRAEEVARHLGVRCRVVPNGIDLNSTLGICPVVARFAEYAGCWDADVVLLQPARLTRRKQIECGIRLTAALQNLELRATYLVTGAPDPHRPLEAAYATELRDLLRHLRLEGSVHFVNEFFPVGPTELRGLYAIADALFFPSRQEGFGLPMLEAGAHRMPAFCPDIEPLRGLPGAICFTPQTPSHELAPWLIRQIGGRHAIQSRKSIAKNYRWPAIYRNFLAPLLSEPHALDQ
ncbi:MAG: hypothetical protein RLZZ244_914 [Verrucomicrobiota bacterium]